MKSVLFLLLLCYSVYTDAQNQVALQQFSKGYTKPLDIQNCGDSRLFIVQQTGQMIICDSTGKRINKPYLDISDRVFYNGGELGLLGAAFDPDYASNGFVYVQYINKNNKIQISRFKRNASDQNKANASSEKIILTIDKPPFISHNGGCIRFGADGDLYIGLGDGGGEGDPYNLSQNKASFFGKMLRIDVHHGNPYNIPADNPFADSAGYKKEIWALGLRNPWRWSFDALNGALFIGDVGQDSWEEIDEQPAGKGGQNYGWRCYEGKHIYNDSGCHPQRFYTMPIYEYPHSDVTGECSVTGGFVYRGTKYKAWYGKYFFSDYCAGIIKMLTITGKKTTEQDVFNGDDYAYTSFGEDYKHELYLTNINTGVIYQIVPAGSKQIADEKSIINLEISPNPSHGNLVASFVNEKIQTVTITVQNALGQIFYKQSLNSNAGKNALNVNLHVPPAVYYIIFTSADGGALSKQIKIE
ncbi:MAG: PQQ-dependent sugar dehydrogenase [Parafilimonas sp.]|nr:PQQ-dependent sugar dehydrogenase [Parafilimonas sp.]